MSGRYRLTAGNRTRLLEFIARLDVSRDWEIAVEPYRKRRTNTQNARLWKLHSMAAEVTGYAAEEMHELMLKRYYGTKDVKVGAAVIQVPLQRSSSSDVREFAKFMEAVEQFYIAELGVWLDKDVRQEDAPQRKAA